MWFFILEYLSDAFGAFKDWLHRQDIYAIIALIIWLVFVIIGFVL
jgi:hypothetical protein